METLLDVEEDVDSLTTLDAETVPPDGDGGPTVTLIDTPTTHVGEDHEDLNGDPTFPSPSVVGRCRRNRGRRVTSSL